MLRKFCLGAFAVGICLAGSAAHAAIADGEKVTISRTVGSNVTFGGGTGGGEFLITEGLSYVTLPGETQQIYKTFCLEKDEYVAVPGTYFVTIDDDALYGGVNVSGTGADALSDATKWLYYWYYTGVLNTEVPGWNYGMGADADLLQLTFWHLEDELGSGSMSNALLTAVAGKVWDNTYGKVMALNLWSNYNPSTGLGSGEHQSQLYYELPEPQFGSPLPEPMSVAVWGVLAGVGSVVAWRRRRRVEG